MSFLPDYEAAIAAKINNSLTTVRAIVSPLPTDESGGVGSAIVSVGIVEGEIEAMDTGLRQWKMTLNLRIGLRLKELRSHVQAGEVLSEIAVLLAGFQPFREIVGLRDLRFRFEGREADTGFWRYSLTAQSFLQFSAGAMPTLTEKS